MKKYDILFVDDQQGALHAFERQFRKDFSLRTATSAAKALAELQEGQFAVLVSDMCMPGMDGIQLLARVKKLYPDMVRIMLTGDSDPQTAIEAVNSGEIYRFLTKPCNPQTLRNALEQAIRQFNLVTAEKELLNQTLKGSIRVLTELLSLANPTVYSRGYRVKDTVVRIVQQLRLERQWQYEIAALMSQIGCVTIPEDILKRLQAGSALTSKERSMYHNHPKVGAELIGKIPRLALVASMVEHQLLAYDEFLEDPARLLSEEEQTGAQILKVAIDHDSMLVQGVTHSQAIQEMKMKKGVYNPEIMNILSKSHVENEPVKIVTLNFEDILPGMVADEDILAGNGAMIISRGQEITWPVIQELTNYLDHIGIRNPIRVRTTETCNIDLSG